MFWTFLWFQIQVVIFFIGALTKTLSLLKVGMLVFMAMNVALPYQTVLGLGSACLRLDFFRGVGPLVQASSQKFNSSLWVRNELFSWWDYQFQFASSFSKGVPCLAFITVLLSHTIPTQAFSALRYAPSPPGRGEMSLCVFGYQFCAWVGWCNKLPSCARICSTLQNIVCHAHLVGLQICLGENGSVIGQHW
jgi:hypothetical protein